MTEDWKENLEIEMRHQIADQTLSRLNRIENILPQYIYRQVFIPQANHTVPKFAVNIETGRIEPVDPETMNQYRIDYSRSKNLYEHLKPDELTKMMVNINQDNSGLESGNVYIPEIFPEGSWEFKFHSMDYYDEVVDKDLYEDLSLRENKSRINDEEKNLYIHKKMEHNSELANAVMSVSDENDEKINKILSYIIFLNVYPDMNLKINPIDNEARMYEIIDPYIVYEYRQDVKYLNELFTDTSIYEDEYENKIVFDEHNALNYLSVNQKTGNVYGKYNSWSISRISGMGFRHSLANDFSPNAGSLYSISGIDDDDLRDIVIDRKKQLFAKFEKKNNKAPRMELIVFDDAIGNGYTVDYDLAFTYAFEYEDTIGYLNGKYVDKGNKIMIMLESTNNNGGRDTREIETHLLKLDIPEHQLLNVEQFNDSTEFSDNDMTLKEELSKFVMESLDNSGVNE